jgi:hypothetical protein
MTIRRLEKPEWRPFFDAVSKLLEAKDAEVEVASLDLGDRTQAEWLPLLGITYDPRDDVVDIALKGLDHIIRPGVIPTSTPHMDRLWGPQGIGQAGA